MSNGSNRRQFWRAVFRSPVQLVDAAADPERCENAKWRHELAKTFGRADADALGKAIEAACRR